VLNQAPFKGNTKILVTGNNFGCGSSREHAPWALLDLGIRCVISTTIAEIFRNNCFANGMLPVTLPKVSGIRSRSCVPLLVLSLASLLCVLLSDSLLKLILTIHNDSPAIV